MESAKKVDSMFGVHRRGKHTVRDAGGDIHNIAQHFLSYLFSPQAAALFEDPTTVGWKKLADGWLDKVINYDIAEDEEAVVVDELDLD